MRIQKLKHYGYDFGEMIMQLNIHQKIMIAFVAVVFIISLYDVLFHFVLGALHVLFESVEFVLDHVIEHLLETGTRETQLIVFYILMLIIGGSLYRLYRSLPRWGAKLKALFQRQKDETIAQWRELSVLWQMAWWSFFITAANCWLFLT